MTGETEAPHTLAWWRESYERDREEFEREHGRPPDSLYELSIWIARRSERTERSAV